MADIPPNPFRQQKGGTATAPANPFRQAPAQAAPAKAAPTQAPTNPFRQAQNPFRAMPSVNDQGFIDTTDPISVLGKVAKQAWDYQTMPIRTVFEALDREEAAVAEPIIRKMQGREDVANGITDGIMGRSQSPVDPTRYSQLGDIFRMNGFSEPLAATAGFLTSLVLPSNLAIGGLIGKAEKGMKLLKAAEAQRVAGRSVRNLRRAKVAEGVAASMSADDVGGAVKSLEESGLFGNITERIKRVFSDLHSEEVDVLRAQEQLAQEAPEMIKKPYNPFTKEAIAKRTLSAQETVVKDILREWGPQSIDDMLLQMVDNGDGTLRTYGKIGEAQPTMRFIDDLNRILTDKVETGGKDINFIRQAASDFLLPKQTFAQHPEAFRGWKLGRQTEQFIKDNVSKYLRRLDTITEATGIKAGSLQAKQVALLLDTYGDLREIPKGAGLVDDIIARQTNPKLRKAGEVLGANKDIVANLARSIFPNAQATDDILVAFDMARSKILNPLARELGLSKNQSIRAYFTRAYEQLIHGIKKEDAAALLNKAARDLKVDPVMHESIMLRLEELGKLKVKPEQMAKGTGVVDKSFPKPTAHRARRLAQERRDELFSKRNWDFHDVTANYVSKASNAVGMNGFNKAMSEGKIMESLSGTKIGPVFEKWHSAFRGLPGGGSFANEAAQQLAAWESTRQFVSKIGFRPITALVNLTQTPLNTLSAVVKENGFVGGANVFMKSLVDYFSKGGQKLIAGSGVLDTGIMSTENFARNRDLLSKVTKLSGIFFNATENFNRGFAYLAGRNTALRQGAKAYGAIEGRANMKAVDSFARNFVDDTQFIFGKSNRPLFLQTPIGSAIGRFKIFTLNQIDFFARTLKDPKAALTFTGMLTALGGPAAIPGMEGLRQQMNEKYPDSTFTKILNETQRRSLAGQLGVDFSGRLGIPLLQEIQMFSSPLRGDQFNKAFVGMFGPTVSDAANFFKAMNDMKLAGISNGTLRNFTRILSTQAYDIMEVWEAAKTGTIKAPDGKILYEVPKEDMAKLAMGFDSEKIARERVYRQRIEKVDADLSESKKKFYNMLFSGNENSGGKAMNYWMDQMEKGNFFTIDETSLKEQIMTRMMTASQRTYRGASKVAKAKIPFREEL